ncbi:tripartite tricarboxylate transporter substrate binding protein [Variovorax beijingensis]|uniref:Tripartite tricarboxylate transporter substrate binding protein n=1 Tax=Variovorax beijingensis TaxID=2496117 RepID=A0A3P3EK06_9BURK|nr:tripartite tricarboxylate transporter substrate binding protein [Variovorax beijingensis]RRH86723.1 tripartite tricarboxylate transporter substrate binding protein [Variovorax beijingensis]
MKRRQLLACLSAGLVLATAASSHAQTAAADWPKKPVRWVVPFPPGGAMDVIARVLGEKAGKALGQPFVIENRAGAGGNIGADAVAKSAPDGYTLLITSIGMATNKPLYGKLSYDPVADFAPVSLLAVVPNVLVTNGTQPNVRSVADVIEAARKSPGKLTYASAGNGTSIHLAGEMFTSLTRTEMLHVPYKGSGPAMADLLGGQVNYMFDSITSAHAQLQSGKLRALAVTTARRSRALPNVPTMAEAGVAGYDVSPWFAVFVPAGTPRPIVDKLHKVLTETLKQPEVAARLEGIGAEAVGSNPEELAAHLAKETKRWSKLIAERNIRLD